MVCLPGPVGDFPFFSLCFLMGLMGCGYQLSREQCHGAPPPLTLRVNITEHPPNSLFVEVPGGCLPAVWNCTARVSRVVLLVSQPCGPCQPHQVAASPRELPVDPAQIQLVQRRVLCGCVVCGLPAVWSWAASLERTFRDANTRTEAEARS